MIGKKIGDYEVIGEIGEGAMGKVYLAQNVLLPAMRVVLKILKDSRQKERFLAEATNLSRLDHKNICQLKHFFHSEGDLIIAMQQIDGKSLADLTKEWKEIDLAKVKSIVLQLLDGLDHAHQIGVHHRDIKLSNIMIDKHAVVKIIDFGIARHTHDPRYTGKGLSVGTPQYMAPEQFTEKPLDDYSRCDIYSLGICLYELCTGRLPFEDTDLFVLRDKHCLETPPLPSSINPDVYYSLESVIMRAMAKSPLERFADPAEMRAELAAAERGVGPLTGTAPKTPAVDRPPTTRRKRKIKWSYAVILVFGAVAAYLILPDLIGPEKTQPIIGTKEQRDTINPLTVEQLDTLVTTDTERKLTDVAVVSDMISPPQLSMENKFNMVHGSPIHFKVSVELGGPGDSLLGLSYYPRDGLGARRLSTNEYEMTFNPPDPGLYEVNFVARGRGGKDTVLVQFFVQEQEREIHLTISPPSDIILDGKVVTENPASEFTADVEETAEAIIIMNPRFPLYTISLGTDAGSLRKSVDLKAIYSNNENVELRVNIVRSVGAGYRVPLPDILINGQPQCELKQRCHLLAGNYLIKPAADPSLVVDSIKFNREMMGSEISIFQLKTPSEGVRFNTLVFYAH